METKIEYKVSGTGWLCAKINGNWLPVTKLTIAQLKDCLAIMESAV
jgi:hypothetical protein